VKVTHGATKKRLARGSEATTREVVKLREKYPEADVFFSTYTYNSKPDVEEKLTRELLPNSICIGSIPTTSAEAIALKEKWVLQGGLKAVWPPRVMIIVTDEFNSGRTRYMYKIFFPKTEIYIVAIPAAETFDLEAPIVNFRNLNRAICMEVVAGTILFWLPTRNRKIGEWFLTKMAYGIRQKSAED